jgi:hypothetical protein
MTNTENFHLGPGTRVQTKSGAIFIIDTEPGEALDGKVRVGAKPVGKGPYRYLMPKNLRPAPKD